MKYVLLLIMSLLLVFAVGCDQQVEKQPEIGEMITSVVKHHPEPESGDIRLTSHGFDTTKLTIEKGSNVVIYIIGDGVDMHYVTVSDSRVYEKGLDHGERITIPFEEKGRYHVKDESGKHTLKVRVI